MIAHILPNEHVKCLAVSVDRTYPACLVVAVNGDTITLRLPDNTTTDVDAELIFERQRVGGGSGVGYLIRPSR